MNFNIFKLSFFIILILILFLGGLLQFFGILTISQVSILIIIICWIATFYRLVIKGINIGIIELLLLCLLLIIIFHGIKNNTPILWQLYYCLFAILPMSIFVFFKLALPYINIKKIKILLIFVACIQMPVLILQKIFYKSLLFFSYYSSSILDITYGTFFVKNDHILGYFILSVITMLIFIEKKSVINNILIGYLTLTLFFMNSKISIVLLLFIYCINILKYKKGKIIILLTTIILGMCLINIPLIKQQMILIISQFDFRIFELRELYKAGEETRLIAIFQVISEPINIIGRGLYSFYNPYNYKPGMIGIYSQFHWFYKDLGIIVVIISLIVLLKIRVVISNSRYKYYNIAHITMIITYFMIANIMVDPQFIMLLLLFNTIPVLQDSSYSLLRY